jgi:ABC-type cobalamin/Fe3+-siderophores transport system ATPase subunit
MVMKEGRIIAGGPPQEVITPALLQDVFGICGEPVVTSSGRRVLVF